MDELPLNSSPSTEPIERKTIDASDIGELKEEAQRRIEASANDPAAQSYFMRSDKGTILKTEEEYFECQERGIPLKIVSYAEAKQSIFKEDARKSKKGKEKKRKKAARASRKRNRA